MSLATKYRPKDFKDVIGQDAVVAILDRQVETHSFSHSYLLCGASGCGKTTLARIFANKLNGNDSGTIELDAASNNGVDNVRNLVKASQERSISSTYKVYIIDEAHAITTQGWQAFLKGIEEPSTYTIFIFCTTDPQKIPTTIQNRCQRHTITKVSVEKIKDRLKYICDMESISVDASTLQYIAKLSGGSVRQAITYLEQSLGVDDKLSIDNVVKATGGSVYETYFDLANGIIDRRVKDVISIISNIFENGTDVKLFIDQFFSFCLDMTKFCIFKDISVTDMPPTYLSSVNESSNFEYADKYYMYITDKVLDIKRGLKNETSPKQFVEVSMMRMCEWK